LQDGLKLDLNQLARQGIIHPGGHTFASIAWNNSYWGEIATAALRANMSGHRFGTFEITVGSGETQIIDLVTEPRRFGGHQWYFVCERTRRRASVLWRPPGATGFRSRQAWGRQVAYQSQFLDLTNRAHWGKSKIKNRLIGTLDPDEWDLPPKPKGMRWRTYQRYVDRFDRYENALDYGLELLAARFLGRI
jgi:hypothetical protein